MSPSCRYSRVGEKWQFLMRSEAAPYLIAADNSATRLKRIKLGEQSIREGFLQEILDGNPDILPVSFFDESFGPIVSLGREIMGMDNLFISPNGRLTVVETKLWRNPQATRQVLAQILDYASRLATLDYEEFEQRCKSARQCPVDDAHALYSLVSHAFPLEVANEAEFIDRLQKNLRNGRFLLLVVGDGIREGLETILDALHHQSRLHFTFGLVELKIYNHPDAKQLLVLPQVVAHSTEIERAVVTVRGAGSAAVQVEIHSGPKGTSPKLTEQEFLESIEDPKVRRFGEILFSWAREKARIEIANRGVSASIRLPFSSARNGLILVRLFRSGKVFMTPPRLRRVLRNSGVGDDEVLRIAYAAKTLFPAVEIHPDKEKVCSSVRAADLLPRIGDLLAIYDEAIERLEALDPGLESGAEPEESEEEDDDQN